MIGEPIVGLIVSIDNLEEVVTRNGECLTFVQLGGYYDPLLDQHAEDLEDEEDKELLSGFIRLVPNDHELLQFFDANRQAYAHIRVLLREGITARGFIANFENGQYEGPMAVS